MPPLGPQPKGARGTVGHPYSALNLRLLLACFSLVTWTVLGILVLSTGHPGLAAVLGVFALVSVADIVVVKTRRRRRRREDPSGHSLFE
jgi:membrane protein implicated in regulation of membrane protease activity